MPRVELSKEFVQKAICPAGSCKVDYFDTDCRGLLLEVRPSGSKVYYVRYTDLRGRQKQLKLARFDDLSLMQARKRVAEIRHQLAMGLDPMTLKNEAKAVPQFSRFIEEQYLPFVRTYKKSHDTDASLIKNHLLPRFKKRYMDEKIGRAHV